MDGQVNNLSEVLPRVERISPEAAIILRSLPAEVANRLASQVPGPKLLVMGLLSAVRQVPAAVLARRFRVPVRWVLRHRDSCLRALR